MSISSQVLPPAGIAFTTLIDYAGLFPPAQHSMEAAVQEYLALRSTSAKAWMLGRFVVPASRLEELITLLRRANADEAVPLAVIVDSSADHRRWFGSASEALAAISVVRATVPQVLIETLEAPLPPLASKRETYEATIGQFAALAGQAELRSLPIFLELPRDGRWEESIAPSLGALSRARLGAKLRCGGVTAEAVPSVAQVAAFLQAAVQEGVPFKATAGLHHPVRHLDAGAGWKMHGFLNLLAGAIFADDVDASMLEQIVAEEEASAFRFHDGGFNWRDLHADADRLAQTRANRFVGYGSCSFTEPIDDLIELTMLPKDR